jgi:hypothetical protein
MRHLLAGCEVKAGRTLGTAVAMFWLLAGSGCYHVRVIVPQPDPGTEYKKQNVQKLVWGALPKKSDIQASNCLNSTALDEVRVSSNLGYSVLTVGTLGFWSPSQVEWRCSKPHEEPGVIHKPKPASHAFRAAPGPESTARTGHQTIHTLGWGLVAKNAVANNCADSRAMDEVRVNSNLGYHALTVATLGFWSPTTVEWKCSKPPGPSATGTQGSLAQDQTRVDAR